jgi:hypothetical protein
MVESIRDIETKPYLIALNEILVPEELKSNPSKSEPGYTRVVEDLKSWKFNFSLPIVCLSENESKYHLLTGLPIYQAALEAGIQRIWTFLIASQRIEAEKLVEKIILQSGFNKRIITELDFEDFLEFINNKSSNLQKVSGIGPRFEEKISSKRPYKAKEQFQEIHGKKQSLKWLTAFRQI